MTYRCHIPARPRSSLDRVLARAPMDQAEVVERAREAYHAGRGVFFTADQLRAMPWDVRALVEAQARRLYGAREQRT